MRPSSACKPLDILPVLKPATASSGPTRPPSPGSRPPRRVPQTQQSDLPLPPLPLEAEHQVGLRPADAPLQDVADLDRVPRDAHSSSLLLRAPPPRWLGIPPVRPHSLDLEDQVDEADGQPVAPHDDVPREKGSEGSQGATTLHPNPISSSTRRWNSLTSPPTRAPNTRRRATGLTTPPRVPATACPTRRGTPSAASQPVHFPLVKLFAVVVRGRVRLHGPVVEACPRPPACPLC